MRRRIAATLLIACLAAALFAGAQAGSAKLPPRAPHGFFGIAPQTELTDADLEYMKAGGIDTIRWPLTWGSVQPTPKAVYNWESFDPIVAIAARHGMRVLPFVYNTPAWLSGQYTRLPVDSGSARHAWTAFLQAAVQRYGPGGSFWAERAPGVVQYEPALPHPLPIRQWQIWNEANFFYFAFPASPQRYAKLVRISSPAIKAVDPGARVILSGLFGDPTAGGPKGMPAAKFLSALYRSPGIERSFDGIALHPYAVDAETLEELVEELHEVTLANHDRVPLYITEMGWGSQNNLKQVYWFSWKDLAGTCTFCDSVGFFNAGAGFHPKPAWHAFVGITGGRARP